MRVAPSERDRRRSRVAVAWCALLALLVFGALPPLLAGTSLELTSVALLPGAAVVFASFGTLVATRRPDNPAGWLLLVAATGDVLATVLSAYGTHEHERPGTLPFGRVVWTVGGMGWWLLPFVMLPLLMLMFPDGELPGPRWRPVRWALVAAAPVGVVVVGLAQTRIDGEPTAPRNALHSLLPGPMIAGLVLLVFTTVLGASLLILGSLVQRMRRAHGVHRAQYQWLVAGMAAFAVCAVLAFAPHAQNVVIVGFVAFVACMTVAILRYRLYDLGRVVSRTVSYAVLSALLAGCYIAGVALMTDVLPFSSSIGVAASTLAAAALFQPARRRVQAVVDRRFNRARYDAQGVVEAFASRLRDETDARSVSSGLGAAVQRTVEPRTLSLWLAKPST